MLKQLSRLSLDTEGRYGTVGELKCLEDYYLSVEIRISAYQKIRDKEKEVIDMAITHMRIADVNAFQHNSHDVGTICRRDMKIILRSLAAAVLIDDLERLKDMLLLWHLTILKAMNVQKISLLAYQHMSKLLAEYLTVEEAELVSPGLQLIQGVLGY